MTKQKFYRDKLYYWNVFNKDNTIAYAFLDNVKGKSMPITFMVILNIDGSIISSTIIKYRHSLGGFKNPEDLLSCYVIDSLKYSLSL